MAVKPILTMVATVLDTYGNISDIILYNYRTDKCNRISYSKTVELLKSGVCIGNLKLTKRNRLETFPKTCGFNRYCSFSQDGKVIDETIHEVLISMHYDQNDRQYTLYDVKAGRCELVDRNFINSSYDSYNLISNVVDIQQYKTMFSSYYKYKVSKLNMGENILINDFGNLEKCILASNISITPDCIWIDKLNSIESDSLVVQSSIYGISHKGFQDITCSNCDIQTGMIELEVEGIIDCKFGTLKLPISLHKLMTNSIANSNIARLEMYGTTLIKDRFMSNCEISELVIHGKHIQFDENIKKLVGDDCYIQYILVDKNLDNKSSDILYNICDKDVIILTNND